jgi:hypothetical protein
MLLVVFLSLFIARLPPRLRQIILNALFIIPKNIPFDEVQALAVPLSTSQKWPDNGNTVTEAQ